MSATMVGGTWSADDRGVKGLRNTEAGLRHEHTNGSCLLLFYSPTQIFQGEVLFEQSLVEAKTEPQRY